MNTAMFSQERINMVTLKQLMEMLITLPESVQIKRIGYLDIGHMTQEDLADLKDRLIKSNEDWIEACAN
jgi:hypothetical protein